MMTTYLQKNIIYIFMKRFVIFDIHGMYGDLKRVLIKSNFNYSSDLLISIGDLCDRGTQTSKVMNELLNIKNLILVKGNHDVPFYEYLSTGKIDKHWYYNWGGNTTVTSYNKVDTETILKHSVLLSKQQNYYLDNDGNLFVHSGINQDATIEQNDGENMYNNDSMFYDFMHYKNDIDAFENYMIFKDKRIKRVFAGHTPTSKIYPNNKPIITSKYIDGDTGCGKGGKLTIMDIDTLNFWQS